MKLSRQTWKNIVQLALSILTAVATTLGLNSCL
ncbi:MULTISPECIES: smalltalk protein [Hallella]|uniref:Smalltalk protein n=1 Tax=Hallella faecis TaxID=2841596 RepID=A0ABV1FR96_9BACT|nr:MULTISPECIES: smalltalk protein [Hallella]MBS7399095.1 smalltalk protein [Prevotella sp.]MDD7212265.1 smalltalk protein [Leyella stercorea]MBU0290434.1 smalltalk protein [Hallella faecis]MCI7434562.1 smalltalk protein [Prevotella sp.]MDD7146477.1 smalltalk protein [Hallella sp.]